MRGCSLCLTLCKTSCRSRVHEALVITMVARLHQGLPVEHPIRGIQLMRCQYARGRGPGVCRHQCANLQSLAWLCWSRTWTQQCPHCIHNVNPITMVVTHHLTSHPACCTIAWKTKCGEPWGTPVIVITAPGSASSILLVRRMPRRTQVADLEAQLAKAEALLSNGSLVSALPDGGTNVVRRIALLRQQLQTLRSTC